MHFHLYFVSELFAPILVTKILFFGTKVKVFRFCFIDAYSGKSVHGFSFY